MKIALLTDGVYPIVVGGIQVHSFYLAKYLAHNKVKVYLYHPVILGRSQNLLNVFTPEEILYIDIIFIEYPASKKIPGHYIYESYLYSKNIYKVLKAQDDLDFIYAQGFTGWEYIKNKKKRGLKTPIGVNFHGLNPFQRSFGVQAIFISLIFRYFIKYNLCNADYILSLGGKLTDIINNKIKCQRPIIEIPIGIDKKWLVTSEQLFCHKKRVFAFIGRFDKIKGFDVLNKAIINLNKKGIDFRFHFIGFISDKMKVQSDNVLYHGEVVNSDEIKKILRESDVLVCPSYSEGMPTVILEAMSCGLAIIASDVGAVSEQVNGKNGILIKPGSVKELELAMHKMCSIEKEELLSMKQHSLSIIEQKFLWENVIQETIQKITEVIKKNS